MMESPQIHQYIFAGPKPGLSAALFQDYWVNGHAVRYACKIPQIQQYLVATREEAEIPLSMAFFQGVAEIWLANDSEQIASLQTPEFLDGARVDEPNWAAFWQTFVLDTSATVLKQPTGPGEFLNAYTLIRRRAGIGLDEFTDAAHEHAAMVSQDDRVQRCTLGMARRSLYGFGEPRFDAIEVWAFQSRPEAERTLAEFAGSWKFTAAGARFTMLAREHWIFRQ